MAPSSGSACVKSVTAVADCQPGSSRRPSRRIAPGSTRDACACLRVSVADVCADAGESRPRRQWLEPETEDEDEARPNGFRDPSTMVGVERLAQSSGLAGGRTRWIAPRWRLLLRSAATGEGWLRRSKYGGCVSRTRFGGVLRGRRSGLGGEPLNLSTAAGPSSGTGSAHPSARSRAATVFPTMYFEPTSKCSNPMPSKLASVGVRTIRIHIKGLPANPRPLMQH